MSRKKYPINENTLGGRLRSFRYAINFNTVQFSILLGISQGSLSDIENNKTKPSSTPIDKLVHKTDINIYWLFSGKGKMLREKGTNKAYPENSPDNDPESDLITKTVEILKSESIYKTTLTSNINAFHSSIRTQETINKRLATMEKQIAELKENKNPAFSQNI